MYRRRRAASVESLMAVLRALGAPIENMSDAANAIRERRERHWLRAVDPVAVAWGGEGTVDLRVPADSVDGLELVDDEGRGIEAEPAGEPLKRGPRINGVRLVSHRLRVRKVPAGYHEWRLRLPKGDVPLFMISAPHRCPDPLRGWGAFLPLYAVRSRRNWGVGDFTDLEELARFASEAGGTFLGTLPLGAAFLDRPFEPSPYSPASRLFWNELFIDVERVPELAASPEVAELAASPAFRRDVTRARRGSLVDHRLVASMKRRVLEMLAREVPSRGARAKAYREFRRSRPDLDDYALFRSVGDRTGEPWGAWPARLREGRVRASDADPQAVRYHRYVQWVAEEQLSRASRETGGLYLDLPLGVHPAGYDTWRHREAFALDVNAGAPPDSFFTGGQDWGFPPLRPEGIREGGHRYPIACIRQVLRHAAVLRVDHVMGLHRMFWVPKGASPAEGAYVRYPAEELYAILVLEATLAGAAVVGEDLGTVPAYTRQAMRRHGALRSHVLEIEAADARRPLPQPPPLSMASLNTHDMPPFAAFWEGLDIEDRLAQGLLDTRGAARERRHRERLRAAILRRLASAGLLPLRSRDGGEVARACMAWLAAGPARLISVNLEDLWGQTEPQNRPGTTDQRPNWRLKAARSLEQIRSDPEVAGTLEEIHRLRTSPGSP